MISANSVGRVGWVVAAAMLGAAAGDAADSEQTPDRVISPLDSAVGIQKFTDSPSDAEVKAVEKDGEKALRIRYKLEPVHDWGSWISLVLKEAKGAPLDLSSFESLALTVFVEAAAPATTIFRISLYDVDEQGRYEWYYLQDDSLLKQGEPGWKQLRFPLKRFRMPPMLWNPPRNDEEFDLKRIGKIEVAIVTEKPVQSQGAILIRNLGAIKAAESR